MQLSVSGNVLRLVPSGSAQTRGIGLPLNQAQVVPDALTVAYEHCLQHVRTTPTQLTPINQTRGRPFT